jgi:S-DNA-T family DNA segregation ATPase FtsK/SpoIIIE
MMTSNFINPFIKQILSLNNSDLIVINAEDLNIDEEYKSKFQYVDQKFNEIFMSLSNFLKEQSEVYVKNDYNKSVFANKKKINCIIIGIDSFKSRLSDENKANFADLFNNGKDLEIVNFIIVDSIDKIKKFEIESWYKNCVTTNNGIWIGNGINDQFSLKISQKIPEMKLDVPNNFCFVIKRGKVQYVKFIEQISIEDKK